MNHEEPAGNCIATICNLWKQIESHSNLSRLPESHKLTSSNDYTNLTVDNSSLIRTLLVTLMKYSKNVNNKRQYGRSFAFVNMEDFYFDIKSTAKNCTNDIFNSCLHLLEAINVITLTNDGTTITDIDLEQIKFLLKNKYHFEEDDNYFHKLYQTNFKEDIKQMALNLIEQPTEFYLEKLNDEKNLYEALHSDSYGTTLYHRLRSSRSTNCFHEYCLHGTLENCCKSKKISCSKLHFKPIILKHTEEYLGDCSFLNSCFHMHLCKYLHYELAKHPTTSIVAPKPIENFSEFVEKDFKELFNQRIDNYYFPPQWIKCDIRHFDVSILGKFDVIMADPPWDIHMELPYGTMADDEMRALPISQLQNDGYIFLWVTGRAMELGRECLSIWGYERIDELIWVKLNQIQRLIRTGRTGHWLNHGKEHCLIGIKGNPPKIDKLLDCDVLLSEVRDTSHKPDEIYGIIERISPGTRKLEIFGRQHNVQPNWMTLGNQLQGINIMDPNLLHLYNLRYPYGYEAYENQFKAVKLSQKQANA